MCIKSTDYGTFACTTLYILIMKQFYSINGFRAIQVYFKYGNFYFRFKSTVLNKVFN